VHNIWWLKDIVPPSKKGLAYDDMREGDIFYLHWPKNVETRARKIKASDFIFLKQYKTVTHVVLALNDRLLFSKVDPSYPYCRDVLCIKRLDEKVEVFLEGKQSYDQGLGENIQTKYRDNIEEYCRWQSRIVSRYNLFEESNSESIINDFSSSEYSEGKEYLKYHRLRERNSDVIKQKKMHFDKLICEICDFYFVSKYGPIGEGFIEVHHLKPLKEITGETITSIDDLILVCSNCHRMIHRLKPIKYSVQEIKEELIKNNL